MVKIEEDPRTVELNNILKNRQDIEKTLQESQYTLFEEYMDKDVIHGFLEKREKGMVKSKWPFIKPKETILWNRACDFVFELSTMSIYLKGDESRLINIAQKLEDAGYNVTIWV